jgi:hypothetical protein
MYNILTKKKIGGNMDTEFDLCVDEESHEFRPIDVSDLDDDYSRMVFSDKDK